jgi:hypothetical protein
MLKNLPGRTEAIIGRYLDSYAACLYQVAGIRAGDMLVTVYLMVTLSKFFIKCKGHYCKKKSTSIIWMEVRDIPEVFDALCLSTHDKL